MLNMDYHNFLKFISLLRHVHVKIDVCPGDDLQTDRTCWTIQTHSDERN